MPGADVKGLSFFAALDAHSCIKSLRDEGRNELTKQDLLLSAQFEVELWYPSDCKRDIEPNTLNFRFFSKF